MRGITEVNIRNIQLPTSNRHAMTCQYLYVYEYTVIIAISHVPCWCEVSILLVRNRTVLELTEEGTGRP
jgi:hypothetical protein